MQDKTKKVLACTSCYLIACAASLLFLYFAMLPTSFENLDVDETYYYNQALKLVENNYVLNAYRPIGFPLILASILVLASGQFFKTKIILILISSLRAPFLYFFAQKITGNFTVSYLSALASALWPPFIFFSATLYTESISPVFFLAFLICLPRSPSGWLQWVLSGIILAMTILIHPMFLFIFPFVFIIQALEHTLSKFWIVLASCVAFIIPWSAAISLHGGSFLFVSLNSADSLAGGLNEKLYADRAHLTYAPNGRVTWTGPGMWISDDGYISPEEEKNLNPNQRNILLYERTWTWIKTHPYEALYLETVKLLVLWGFYPFLWELKTHIFFGNIPSLTLLLLSCLALWKWRKNYRELCRLWTMPLFVSCVALFAVGSWRYRFPADQTLIVLSIMYLYSIFSSKSLIKSLSWK